MATTDGPARAHDRNGHRHHFASWMKRLASLKSSNNSTTIRWSNKRHGSPKAKNRGIKNNPYPLSGHSQVAPQANSDRASSHISDDNERTRSHSRSEPSITYPGYENRVPLTVAKSTAPTISTNGETVISEAADSKAGTMATTNGGAVSTNGGGEGSTFSSPAPSVRSLTTTLTTVQSAAPSTHIYNTQNPPHQGHHHGNSTTGTQQVQFSHQFPPSPATAVPPHLAPQGQAITYNTATANNILTDNASILTLASSSKRRRRNSLDTNASVRALAPSSVFGGSRESLPLSVLSGVGEASNTSVLNAPGVLSRPSLVGLASVERASIYSSSSPAGGERASFHAKATPATDGASIRSGVHSHTRQDSNAASITGIGPPIQGRISCRSSGWGEITGEGGESDEERRDRVRERDLAEKEERE
ncbi:hypothetical protein BJX70DRAFT_362509 [Aspergillus crustosus]